MAGEDTRAEDARPPSLVVVAAAIAEPGHLLWSVRKMLWRVLPPRRDPLPGWV